MKKTRHVIQVSSYYPPHLGGQENAVHDLAWQLAGAGHHVEVLTSTIGSGPKIESHEGPHVQRLPGFVFGHAPIMPSFPAALLRTVQPGGLVHLHIGQAFTPEMVWLMSKLCGFKYIAQLHIDFEPSGPAGFLLPLYKRLILKQVLQAAAAIITLNEKTLATVRDVYQCGDKALILPNGIDEAYFKLKRPPFKAKPPHRLRLLFVGRLSKQKNIPSLLQALKQTKRQVWLDIVGDGEERTLIEKRIAELGLSNVTLHGRLARPDVMDFYQTADALIMPSLYEAQPLVLLEALAARLPIIGTDVIGVGEHIKDVGIIVPPTAEGLAEGINQFDNCYNHLPDMVQRGLAKAQQLRWRHLLKQYEALYETVGD